MLKNKITLFFAFAFITAISSISLSQVYAEPIIHDKNYVIEEFSTGLQYPTTMTFVGDDILVLEKNTGKVIRISDNGVLYNEIALDVPVIQQAETGLLGITSVSNHIFLYFTESMSGIDQFDFRNTRNVVYQYHWNGENLTNPILIKELPSIHSDHNGGVMTKGLNNEIYFVIGDQDKRTIFQNVPTGFDSTTNETGVIFKMDTENICTDICTELFAIGIRNSFGLAVDPVTGYLWETENGPDAFDEINLVKPGFNSGWVSVMGPSMIVLEDKQKGLTYMSDTINSDLSILNQKPFENFVYSDPEFSWYSTVAPTAIAFPDKDSFRKYSDWLFVGDNNNGRIYNFQLNSDRTGFVFSTPELSDLVLDDDDVMDEIIFASGFQGVTDIKFRDGAMYVVVIGNGSIYKIYPKETLTPLKQYQNDVPHKKIVCKTELMPIMSKSGYIYCVQPTTAITLNNVLDWSINHPEMPKIELKNQDLQELNFEYVNLSNSDFRASNFHTAKISNTNLTRANLSGADLSGVDLTGTILRGADLSNANLSDVDLSGVDLTGTRLVGVNLSGVDLTGTILTGADLTDANLSNVDLSGFDLTGTRLVGVNLSGVDLTGTILTGADLTDANLSNVDLSGFDLTGTILTGADLTDANLSNVDLSGVDLTGTILTGADLTDANLSNVDLSGRDLTGTRLVGVDLSGRDLTGTILTGADLTDANLSNVDLSGRDLTGTILTGADLSNAYFGKKNIGEQMGYLTSLSGFDLTGTRLVGVDLSGFDLTGTILIGADLSNAILIDANLIDVNLQNSDLRSALLVDTNLTNAILTGADLTNAILTGAILTGADLTDANLSNVYLSGRDLTGTRLVGVDMSGRDLTGTILTGADLTGADLSNAILIDANLIDVNLQNSDLRSALLVDTNLTNAILTGADLTNAILTGAILTGADLENAVLTNAVLNCMGHPLCV